MPGRLGGAVQILRGTHDPTRISGQRGRGRKMEDAARLVCRLEGLEHVVVWCLRTRGRHTSSRASKYGPLNSQVQIGFPVAFSCTTLSWAARPAHVYDTEMQDRVLTRQFVIHGILDPRSRAWPPKPKQTCLGKRRASRPLLGTSSRSVRGIRIVRGSTPVLCKCS